MNITLVMSLTKKIIKLKYTKTPLKNYGMRVKGNEVEYYFDFLLAQPQALAKIMNLR